MRPEGPLISQEHRQAKRNKEQLNDQGRVADELNIAGGDGFQVADLREAYP
jgi:hypothetical protein